ncbi:Tim10/DDP zinc finger [Mactra antiquata]
MDPRAQQMLARTLKSQEAAKQIELLTETCWDKCVGYPGNKIDSKTEYCIRNCVSRYVDTSYFIGQNVQQRAQQLASSRPESAFS